MALRAANLYAAGDSFGKIGEELSISKSRVGDLIRKGIFDLANHDIEPDEAPDDDPSVQMEGEQENDPENADPGFSAYEDSQALNGMLEKTILIQATPLFKKVLLNSKVFLQHEYFQKYLEYEGDVGDLLVEALDFYWKEMGFTIKITHDSVM